MYQLHVDLNEVRATVDRVASMPDPASRAGRRFGELTKKIGSLVQNQAIYNVSDHTVEFEGNVFKIRSRTGALKGAIELEYPYGGSSYKARVYVRGTATATDTIPGQKTRYTPVSEYAASIEFGHKEIDLKKTMMGKIVPFFAARSQSATGPYAVAGLTPLSEGHGSQSPGSKWRPTPRETRSNMLRARSVRKMVFTQKGKATSRGGSGTYYIAFRRVGKTGWIIPAKKARPFMGATMSQVEDKVRTEVNRAVRDVIRGDT